MATAGYLALARGDYRCVSYTVGVGDTLWGIVSRYYPDAHTGEMVWAIRSANDLCGADGPMLRPGQVLWIPDPAMYGKN